MQLEGYQCISQSRMADMDRQLGITERTKDESALEWVQRFHNMRACAGKIVGIELIYQ